MAAKYSKLSSGWIDTVFPNPPSSPQNGEDLPSVVLKNRYNRAKTRLQQVLETRGTDQIEPKIERRVKRLVRDWHRQDYNDDMPSLVELEMEFARDRDLVIAQQSNDPQKLKTVLRRRYLEWVAHRHGRIEIQGLRTASRVRLDLDRLYVPLALFNPFPVFDFDLIQETIDAAPENLPEPASQHSPSSPATPAPSTATEHLAYHHHLWIVGGPGSGKTTLLADLALHPPDGLLPIIIPARFLDGSLTLRDIYQLADGGDPNLLESALKSEGALLLIDGLDELPAENREKLTASIPDLLARYPATRAIVTSRPLDQNPELPGGFEEFEVLKIRNFTPEQRKQFVHQWCLAAETSLLGNIPEARRQAKEAATDLLEHIERSEEVARLADNPLLTTILCIVHRFHGKRIPEHRVTLYERCADALLHEWDAAKPGSPAPLAEIGPKQQRALLATIARHMLDHDLVSFSKDNLEKLIQGQLPDLGISETSASDLLAHIRDRSGILVELSLGNYGFSHLSFLEYFAATTFRTQEFERLVENVHSPIWRETLLLVAGLESTDAGELAEELLKQNNMESDFVAFQLQDIAMRIPVRTRRAIEARFETHFPPKDYIHSLRIATLVPVSAPAILQFLKLKNYKYTTEDYPLIAGLLCYPPALHQLKLDDSFSTATLIVAIWHFSKQLFPGQTVPQSALKEIIPKQMHKDLPKLHRMTIERMPKSAPSANDLLNALQGGR